MEEKHTLLTKLKEKLKNMNTKVVKRIAGLALAAAMLVVPLSACQNNTNTPVDPGTDINNPVDENKNHSAILNKILTDSYYRNLVNVAENKKNYNNDYDYAKNNNAYTAIPYGFLEKQGYDINAIKNNQLECITDVCIRNKDLYVELKIEHKSSIDYYANYILKYNLTDKELSDFKLLYSLSYPCYQAPQFVQELSYQKNATVEHQAYITKTSFKNVVEEITHFVRKSGKVNSTGLTNPASDLRINLLSFKENENTVTFLIHENVDFNTNGRYVFDKTVAIGTFDPVNVLTTSIDGKTVFSGYTDEFMFEENREKFNNSKYQVTYYNSDGVTFADIFNSNLYGNIIE